MKKKFLTIFVAGLLIVSLAACGKAAEKPQDNTPAAETAAAADAVTDAPTEVTVNPTEAPSEAPSEESTEVPAEPTATDAPAVEPETNVTPEPEAVENPELNPIDSIVGTDMEGMLGSWSLEHAEFYYCGELEYEVTPDMGYTYAYASIFEDGTIDLGFCYQEDAINEIYSVSGKALNYVPEEYIAGAVSRPWYAVIETGSENMIYSAALLEDGMLFAELRENYSDDRYQSIDIWFTR